MSESKADPVFTQGSLMRHVSVMSFTASIGLMAIFAVDMIDLIFISMLGKDALAAAAGYASTVLFFTNSINIGLSIAAGALVSKALGAGEEERAKEYATNVVIFAAITGITLPFFIMPNLDLILGFLGASGEVSELAAGYLWVIMPSMAIIGIAMTCMAALRAHGDARRSMYSTLSGGTANAIFDPIFIFVFALDLQGAAIASVIARLVMMGVAVRSAIHHHDALAKPKFGLLIRDFMMVSKLALPAVLTNIATPIGTSIMTREMSKFGADAIAGMAVIGRLTPVAFSVVMALSGALGPIIGQNYGAGLQERVKIAFIDSLKFIAIIVLVATAILFVFREQIADVFNTTGLARTLIFLFCGPLALVAFFNGATFAANATFNNLGHPLYSTWINWGKNTIGTLPFILAGAALWGAPGILIGQAIGAVLFAAIAIFLAMKVIADPSRSLVQEYFTRHRREHVMCNHGRW